MAFHLPLFGWTRPEATTPRPDGAPVGFGDAVAGMIAARMEILQATFRARAAFLRAQADSTDSIDLRRELLARAAEVDFLLGEAGK